jgi:hypothetical protein
VIGVVGEDLCAPWTETEHSQPLDPARPLRGFSLLSCSTAAKLLGKLIKLLFATKINIRRL